MVPQLATRLAGSSDLYQKNGRAPFHSVNFVTCHDGFTLHDLVTYTVKRNEANGEDNRDGSDDNFSSNYGVEGETEDAAITAIRNRQIKNFLATLLLSQGVPMLLGGDEFRRTQRGNNNAYCQNNEISWYDWSFLQKHADIYRFTQQLIAQRQTHPVFRRTTFFIGQDLDGDQFPDVHWYELDGSNATWDPTNVQLICTLSGSKEEIGRDEDDVDVLMMFNADIEAKLFRFPNPPNQAAWYMLLNTDLPSPHDIYPVGQEEKIDSRANTCLVKAQSMVVMIAK